ncbi:MAG: UDP-N-acetylglucosamine 2-epimerase [Promethearchaeota archaeon]
MDQKHVCVVTGSRADYNYLKSTIEKIKNSTKLKLSLIVTGMHLLEKHGKTIKLIEKDRIPIAKIIPMYNENDRSSKSLGKSVGESIIKFTEVFDELKPDLLLIVGDRFEALVAALAASTLHIPIAHIGGGDISGNIDETLRHVITKLSHIHFPATPTSKERIERMGEEHWRIQVVGSTTIDTIMNENLLNREKICDKLELNASEKIVLCVLHPNVFESERAGEQMKITLQVLKDMNLQTVIIYPNNDLGSHLIIQEINKNRNNPKFKIFKNLERKLYLSLLKNADLLIGNSSGGFYETPIFKIPVVNLGTRNKYREKIDNVINVDNFEYNKIKNAVNKSFSDEFRQICQDFSNPWGDGTASDKIVNFLEDLEINDNLLIKKLTYDI